MTPNPPTPVLKNFLLCREILQDRRTNQYILIGPLISVMAPAFPTVFRLMAFVQMSSMHGTYVFKFQLQNVDDQVMWEDTITPPLEHSDPLALNTIAFYALAPYVPRVGKYDLVLLANGQEIGRQVLLANPAGPDTSHVPST